MDESKRERKREKKLNKCKVIGGNEQGVLLSYKVKPTVRASMAEREKRVAYQRYGRQPLMRCCMKATPSRDVVHSVSDFRDGTCHAMLTRHTHDC